MLLAVILPLFLSLQLVKGSPTFQEEYRGSYVPEFVDTAFGRQVLAPDTPYVATSGHNSLYFIDTRHDAETAAHIKAQIERVSVPIAGEYLFIDEIAATAEVRDSTTDQATFVFDPPYARVMFAKGINKLNSGLKLPLHEPAGSWEVSYDGGNTLTTRIWFCDEIGCHDKEDCIRETHGNCRLCHHYRVDHLCDEGHYNAIGICTHGVCLKAVDTPKQAGESDATYYQRMDRLHWH